MGRLSLLEVRFLLPLRFEPLNLNCWIRSTFDRRIRLGLLHRAFVHGEALFLHLHESPRFESSILHDPLFEQHRFSLSTDPVELEAAQTPLNMSQIPYIMLMS